MAFEALGGGKKTGSTPSTKGVKPVETFQELMAAFSQMENTSLG